MREDLDKKLCEKYPEIFIDRTTSINQSCMAWGFTCGDGWYTLIDELCASIMWHCKNHGPWDSKTKKSELIPIPIAVQVKEKFGTLRFYIQGGDERIEGYVSFAETLSRKICEDCGEMDSPTEAVHSYGFGWVRTLCVDCAIKQYGQEKVDEYNRQVKEK